jgi:nitrogen fixation-related uncharacterized protein
MIRFEDKRVIGGAAIVSLILLIAVAIEERHSPVVPLVVALGAIGQIWVAVMLWRLTKAQFDFTKGATERQIRSSTYERRVGIILGWSQSSLQIGYTDINEENVSKLRGLLSEIELLFGLAEKEQAKAACDAARAARNRSREVRAQDAVLRDDPVYREHIDMFKEAQKRTWIALKTKTGIETV